VGEVHPGVPIAVNEIAERERRSPLQFRAHASFDLVFPEKPKMDITETQ
jgi:hypothetical protein